MSAIHWLAIHWQELGAGVLLTAFIVFALRQGMKVRPLESRRTTAGKARADRILVATLCCQRQCFVVWSRF